MLIIRGVSGMKQKLCAFILSCMLVSSAVFAEESAFEQLKPEDAVKHTIQKVEGWTVHVDEKLLKEPFKERGDLALRLLANELLRIRLRLPESRIRDLQTVHIHFDLKHKLTSMQYHPGKGWLVNNGYDPKLVKCVHIPRVDRFVNHLRSHSQPWALMHELAHAYHDQFLGFENRSVKGTFDRFVKENGKQFESIRHINGHNTKHYALTNEKEFFAEMTESFIGTNDFFPFVRGELRAELPEVHALMKAVWMDGKREN